MNEQIRPNPELTPRPQYSTLNTRSTMPEPTEPQPGQPRPNVENPNMSGQRTVDERQGMRIALEVASERLGRPLTNDETFDFLTRMVRGVEREEDGEERPRDRQGLGDEDDGGEPVAPRSRRGGGEVEIISLDPAGVDDARVSDVIAGTRYRSDDYNAHGFLATKLTEIDNLENVSEEAKERGKQKIRDALSALRERYSVSEDFRGFVLQKSDEVRLLLDPKKWLSDQFDNLYNLTESGNELESENVRRMQSLVGEAIGYLNTKQNPFQKSFEELYNTQFNLLFMAKATRDRNMEQIVGSSQRLRSSGILTAASFENGLVEAMFNRYQNLLDDARLRGEGEIGKIEASRFHVSAELASTMGKRIEAEQLDLAIRGVGVFSDSFNKYVAEYEAKFIKNGMDSKDAKDVAKENAKKDLRNDIKRVVKTGEGIFVSTQREAVISARGRYVQDPTAVYYSDVGAVYNAFNLEDFTIGKWGTLNHEQNEFLDRIKLDLAEHESASKGLHLTHEEKLDLGRRLFRDLFVVPDFFTSGWRIMATREQIEKVQLYEMYNARILKDLLSNGSKIKNEAGDTGLSPEQRDARKKIREMFGLRNDADLQTIIRDELSFEERQMVISMLGLTKAQREDLKGEAKASAENLALFMQLKAAGGDKTKRAEVWEKIKTYRPEELFRQVRERDSNAMVRINAIFTGNPSLQRIFKENFFDKDEELGGYDKFKKHYGGLIQSLRERALREPIARQANFQNLTSEEIEIAEKFGGGTAALLKQVDHDMKTYIQSGGLINTLVNDQKYEDIYSRTMLVDDAILGRLEKVPENSGITRLSQIWSTDAGADAFKRNFNDIGNALKAGGSLISFLTAEGKDKRLEHAEAFAKSVGEYNGTPGIAKAFRYTFGSFLLTSEQDYLADLMGTGKFPFRLASSDIERIFGPGVSPMDRNSLLKELDHVRGILTMTANEKDPEKYYREMVNLLGIDSMSRFKDRSLTISIYLALMAMLIPAAVGVVSVTESASK